MRRMMEECVQSKFSAADMMYKLSMLEVLEDILFEEHDKTLLPFVIMKRYKNKLIEQKIKGSKQKRRSKRKSIPKKNNSQMKQKESIKSPPILNKINKMAEGSSNAAYHNDHLDGAFKKEATQQKESQSSTNIFNPIQKSKQPPSDKAINDEEMPSAAGQRAGQKESEGGEADFDKAYRALVSSSPKTPIKKAIRNYMIQSVQDYFEGHKIKAKKSSKLRAFTKKRLSNEFVNPYTKINCENELKNLKSKIQRIAHKAEIIDEESEGEESDLSQGNYNEFSDQLEQKEPNLLSVNLDPDLLQVAPKNSTKASKETPPGGKFTMGKQISKRRNSRIRMQHQGSRFSRLSAHKKVTPQSSKSLRFIKDPKRRIGSLNEKME